jgi:NAD(P)-dependent dehydrogenase (short-subunit alcohol dehydrogenase family)
MKLKPLNQQVVVVMGASSGIGRAAALDFAARGAAVMCSARDEEGLATVVQEIRSKGGKALAVVADVADPEQMTRLADFTAQEMGRIDTWVHVAAVSVYARFEDTTPAEFARVIEVNLLGQVHGAQAALPHLRRAGRGALIAITSIEGRISEPFQSAYAASKHGVMGFLDSLRLELQREGVPISVTAILPAGINTPLFQKALTRLGVEPRPTAPIYAPELVSRAILYAASHPVRELVIGGAGMAFLLGHRLSPALTDAILRTRVGFESQLTDRPKSPDAPNNLFEPSQPREARVEGVHSDEAVRRSLLTQLPQTRVAAAARRVVRALADVQARVFEAGWRLTLPRAARRALTRRPAAARRRRAIAR